MFGYYLRLASDLAQAQPRADRADGRRDRARHRHVDDLDDRAARDVRQPDPAQERRWSAACSSTTGTPTSPTTTTIPTEPPDLMTYQDVTQPAGGAGRRSTKPCSSPTCCRSSRDKRDLKPYMVEALFTTRDFFPMFEPPFLYGSGWSDAEDRNAARVVVIGKATNEKLFGGENSVGRRLRLGGEDYTHRRRARQLASDAARLPHLRRRVRRSAGSLRAVPRSAIEKELQQLVEQQLLRGRGQTRATQGLLNSECIWIDIWVQLEGRGRRRRAT